MQWNRSLFGLGYLTDSDYYDLLEGAWALVMPTLAEGGGSFPVLEAMENGIPVVASDIPVMREMLDRFGGKILWFDPSDPGSLAATVAELESTYPAAKQAAVAQVGVIRPRSWAKSRKTTRHSSD